MSVVDQTHQSIYMSSNVMTLPGPFTDPKEITIGLARDTWAEATYHHRNLSPTCQRVAAWEDCRLNLRSPDEKIQRSCSREKAAGFLVFSEPGSSEEVHRG